MIRTSDGKLILGNVEYVNCQRPVQDINADIKILNKYGYLVTGQEDWDLIFEHPDKGNSQEIMKKHKEHLSRTTGIKNK